MKTEYEIRVLEVDAEDMIKRIEKLGGKKVGEFNQRRYVYDLKPVQENKWIRLRTNETETTLTFKNIESNTMDGTKELEIKVDDFEKANEFLNILGYNARNYQENKRIRYILDGIEIDFDSWPMIPTYMEIEGPDEDSINKMINKLNISKDKITALNCNDIYKTIYNIDTATIKNLTFNS